MPEDEKHPEVAAAKAEEDAADKAIPDFHIEYIRSQKGRISLGLYSDEGY